MELEAAIGDGAAAYAPLAAAWGLMQSQRVPPREILVLSCLRVAPIVLVTVLIVVVAHAQSSRPGDPPAAALAPAGRGLAGVQLGAPASTLARLGPPEAEEPNNRHYLRKWELTGGNELSVTTEGPNGPILYIELNWSGEAAASGTGFQGLTFGTTLLRDIRTRAMSNGFMFGQSGVQRIDDGVALLNSYELDEDRSKIVTFVTVAKGRAFEAFQARTREIDDVALLDAIIFADKAYLTELWGSPGRPDQGYRPIR